MSEQNQTEKALVCVKSITYNQAPYIEDTMNGFCMQKTDFPFVCTIIDDASTDGEQDVIRRYLRDHFDMENQEVVRNEETDDYILTYARHKENQNCFFAVLYLKYNHYSVRKGRRKNGYIKEWLDDAMYVAICEGDDYWTDSQKLQKQVNYLESHPECGLTYTNSMIYNQKKGCLSKTTLPKQSDFKNLLIESPIMTLTTCFRKNLYTEYFIDISPNSTWLMGDLPLWLYIASQSEIKYLPDATSVYRILEESLSHSNNIDKEVQFCMSSYNIRRYFAEKYLSTNLVKQICITHINELFKIAINKNKNLSHIVAKWCLKESIFTPLIWLKIILYSSPLGRKYHRHKYN